MFKVIQIVFGVFILVLFVVMLGVMIVVCVVEVISVMVNVFVFDNFKFIEDVVNVFVVIGDVVVVFVFEVFVDGEFYFCKVDKQVFIIEKFGFKFKFIDLLMQKVVGEEQKVVIDKIKVNNSLCCVICDVLGGLMLQLKDCVVCFMVV